MTSLREVLTICVLGFLSAGCGGENESPAPGASESSEPAASSPAAGSAAPTPSVRARPGTRIATAGSDFGEILFDGTGQAIYLFDKETSAHAECYGPCAEAWPPVLTSGQPRASGNVKMRLLGTTSRTDGTTQVTYAGQPLYFYAHEGKRQVLCHNVSEYGGRWLVLTPGGDPAP